MNTNSASRTLWEYKLLSIGNPLEPDAEMRANALGRQGWELVAIEAGVWIFKRELVEAEEEAQAVLEAIISETVPIASASEA